MLTNPNYWQVMKIAVGKIWAKFKSSPELIAKVKFYGVATLIVLIFIATGIKAYNNELQKYVENQNKLAQLYEQEALWEKYNGFVKDLAETKAAYPQVDMGAEDQGLIIIKFLLKNGNFAEAKRLYDLIYKNYGDKKTDLDKKGGLYGKVISSGKAVPQIDVQIFAGATLTATVKSADDGTFSYWLLPGKYTVKINAGGYQAYSSDVDIKLKEKTNIEIVLTKKASTQAPVQTSSAPEGLYQRINIDTELGSFSVAYMTFNASQYEMIVDTAYDGDCATDCPVMPLSEYVQRNGAIAGIHGTYFCPASYGAECASEVNGFYFKLWNGRLNQRINWSNGLGDYLPFISYHGGSVSYSKTWSAISGSSMTSGVSCRPHLVEDGQIVLQDSDLVSEKERSSKISHGFIGLKGQTIYAGIVFSATMFDSAAVSKALGLDNSFNIDGGGSSALWYGGYKVGPGRDIPNAILFRPR